MRSFRSSSMFLWVVSCSCFCSVFMGTLMFTLSFLLQRKQRQDRNTHGLKLCCRTTTFRFLQRWIGFSLLVSEEEFNDGVWFELHLVHVGVFVLQHLTDRRTSERRTMSTINQRSFWFFVTMTHTLTQTRPPASLSHRPETTNCSGKVLHFPSSTLKLY